MATYTSALQLYKAQMSRFAVMGATARAMHEDLARHGYQDARDLTAGGNGPQFSPRRRWLARNRPFARNLSRVNLKKFSGRGKVQALPIGMISTELYRSWSLRRVSTSRGQEFHLRNRAKHARFILFDGGTRAMIGRGFQARTRRNFKARNKAFIDTLRARQRRAA